ncbi:tetratricopeptide repeat protein [Labilibacter marinus]|uniref:tetratricopeptide repeat protein n=1 Tax=Labilibacter marinus TaxID=1477105 RepID=UPI0009FA9723|nr:tetratricopeptide repeat protein [Labilibacter marinus]
MNKAILKYSLSLLCILCLTWSSSAQSSKPVKPSRNAKLFKKAMQMADQQNYNEAIATFKQVVANDPKDLDALFNMGLCYLNTSNGADTAVICFNKGLDILTDDEKKGYLGTELGLSLGKAYQVLLKPLKAIAIYEELIENSTIEDPLLIAEIEREIQICHHADFFIKNPIDLEVQNMGSTVNSMYDDHSPLIGVSEQQLFFTSRRNWIKLSLLPDGQYAEKVYTVPLSANNWESARLLKVFFKQNEHEAAASLSPDGNQIVLFRNDEHGKSLYLSHYTGRSWTEPEKLPFPINSYSEETHGSISADKSTFFFTSDREGGLGGLDIYMAKKLPNDTWGAPRNLGPNINTEFDEETPMIHYDGKTLYFSSEGHNTMGRLDVFYSQMNPDSTWTIPVNMGYPINTPDDDFFFVPTISKSHAYYASSKFADNYGGSDIYQVKFNNATNTELAVIEGEIDKEFGTDYKKMRVLVTRTVDDQLVGDYRPDPINGQYMMFLENGFEYEVKQTDIEDREKVGYVNVTEEMDYQKTKLPVIFTDVVMDAPLIKLAPATPIIDNSELIVAGAKLDKVDIPEPKPSGKVKSSKTTTVQKAAKSNAKNKKKAETKMPDNVQNVQRFLNNKNTVAKTTYPIKGYTIQLLALKEAPLKNLNYFARRNLKNVQIHLCTDGYTRYSYGEFNSYRECLKLKKELIKNNGLTDIWIRPLSDFAKLAVK